MADLLVRPLYHTPEHSECESIAMRFDVRYDSLQLCTSVAGIRFVVAIASWSGEDIVGVVVYRHVWD